MLRIQGLTKRYVAEWGRVAAVSDVNVDVPAGQLLTLLGPSGCGKTTTLRCVAGLERPDEGEILIGNTVVFSSRRRVLVPPHRRRIGMVFQSYAIWPHMTVRENVAFALEGLHLNRAQMRERADRVLDLVGLREQAERPAPQLSGGQQQRVALARAIVSEPEILLLDEPLSNLDAKLRESMRTEVRALQQRLGITAVYVTHDQAEALAISDMIAVMSGGLVLEIGTPRQLYEHPRHRFTAEFIGGTNVLPMSSSPTSLGTGRCQVESPVGPVVLDVDGATLDQASHWSVTVRPEHVSVDTTCPSGTVNVWPARVKRLTFLGNITECVVTVGGATIAAQLPGTAALEIDQDVYVHVPSRRCVAVRDVTPVLQHAAA